jgi:AAA-like domain
MDFGLRLGYLGPGLIVGSTGGAQVWLRLGTHQWELLPEEQQVALWARADRMLASLGAVSGHLLVVPRALPVDVALKALDDATPRPSSGWHDYLEETRRQLAGKQLGMREVYLGIQLSRGDGRRRSFLSQLLGFLDRATGLVDPRPDETAVGELQEMGRTRLTQVLATTRARFATASELRWLMQRHGRRDEVLPPNRPAWGGELETLVSWPVERRLSHLVIGDDLAGYRHLAVLAADHVPPVASLPGSAAWMPKLLSDLGELAVDVSIRFRLTTPAQAVRDVGAQMHKFHDQRGHSLEVGPTVPWDVAQGIREGLRLEDSVRSGQHGLAYAWPRLLVHADGMYQQGDARAEAEVVAELRQRVARVQAVASAVGMSFQRPAAVHLSLFSESLPGDRVRGTLGRPDEEGDRVTQSYQQAPEPGRLAASMWAASGDLGEEEPAPYLGYTVAITGQPPGTGGRPVMFSAISAAVRDGMPVATMTGPPGGGKTVGLWKLCRNARLQGADVCLLDPQPYDNPLPDMEGLGFTQRIRLDHNYPGLLDIWRIEEDPIQAEQRALEVAQSLLPHHLGKQMEGAIIEAAREETERAERPSLLGLARRLASSSSEERRTAGADLLAMSRWPLSRLLFADEAVPPLRLDGALTVIQFSGLRLPPAGTPREDYWPEHRLAVAVVRALAALASKLMLSGERSTPRVLAIDEYWLLGRFPDGERLADEVARTTRKTNTALLLSTQAVEDVLPIARYVGAKFHFRTGDSREIRAACDLFGIVCTREVQAALQQAQPGECLMSDWAGRVGLMRIDRYGAEEEVFKTTPPRQVPIGAWGGVA